MAGGQRWIAKDGGHHCTAHDVQFARGEVCRACCDDPGPPIVADNDAHVDDQTMIAEAECREVSRKLLAMAEDLAKKDKNLAVKAYDTYLKTLRTWKELHAQRVQVESDERLREHDARINGLRKRN